MSELIPRLCAAIERIGGFAPELAEGSEDMLLVEGVFSGVPAEWYLQITLRKGILSVDAWPIDEGLSPDRLLKVIFGVLKEPVCHRMVIGSVDVTKPGSSEQIREMLASVGILLPQHWNSP